MKPQTVIVDGREVQVSDLPPAPDVLGFDRREQHIEAARRGFTLRYIERWPRPFLVEDLFGNDVFQSPWHERETLYTVERIIGNTLIGKKQAEPLA